MALTWNGDTAFAIGDTSFRLKPIGPVRSQPGSFVLRKVRWMVEAYLDLGREFSNANVFELGINEGGSTALLAEVLAPRRMVAIEIAPEPNVALAQFLRENGLDERVHALYGVDQADRPRIEQILDDHFAGEALDLVIDDASHSPAETRVSFNTLFPRLRPGGVFVIEDWNWAQAVEYLAGASSELASMRDLSPLVVELTLASGYASDVVAEVWVRHELAMVRRGTAEVDADEFDVSACYGRVARRFLGDDFPG